MTKVKNATSMVVLYGLILTLQRLGLNLFYPSMPDITESFKLYNIPIHNFVSLYILGGASIIILATVSDYLGRKKIIITGLFLSTLSSILAFLTHNPIILLCCRIMEGAAIGAATLIITAVNDSFSGNKLKKNLSKSSILFGLLSSLSFPIGATIAEQFTWKYNFLFFAMISFTLAIFCLFCLDETCKNIKNKKLSNKTVLLDIKNILNYRPFIISILIEISSVNLAVVFFIYSPFIFENSFKLSSINYSWLILVITATKMLSQHSLIRLINKKSNYQIIKFSSIMLIACGTILLLLNKYHYLNYITLTAIIIVVFYVNNRLGNITTIISLEKFSDNKGTATTIKNLSYFISVYIINYIIANYSGDKISIVNISIVTFGIIMYTCILSLKENIKESSHYRLEIIK